jgi:hypothetical protein
MEGNDFIELVDKFTRLLLKEIQLEGELLNLATQKQDCLVKLNTTMVESITLSEQRILAELTETTSDRNILTEKLAKIQGFQVNSNFIEEVAQRVGSPYRERLRLAKIELKNRAENLAKINKQNACLCEQPIFFIKQFFKILTGTVNTPNSTYTVSGNAKEVPSNALLLDQIV